MLIAAIVAGALGAAPARAAEVTVVDGDHAVKRDDPFVRRIDQSRQLHDREIRHDPRIGRRTREREIENWTCTSGRQQSPNGPGRRVPELGVQLFPTDHGLGRGRAAPESPAVPACIEHEAWAPGEQHAPEQIRVRPRTA